MTRPTHPRPAGESYSTRPVGSDGNENTSPFRVPLTSGPLSPLVSVRTSPGQLAQLACTLEVLAPKLGNVHPGAAFDDADVSHFLLSAIAIRPILDQVRTLGVGPAILQCVAATRAAVNTNTNLGMVLLLAPLAAAPARQSIDRSITRVLHSLTADDTRAIYQAIRLANPGGLGSAPQADVHEEPTLPILEAMALAADRDAVARQWATSFHDVLHLLSPQLVHHYQQGLALDQAIVLTHLEQIAREPDSLLVRKWGQAVGCTVSRRAQRVLDAGYPHTPASHRLFARLDRDLRRDASRSLRRNPGTSADLVAAALYVCLRTKQIPIPWRWAGSLMDWHWDQPPLD